MPNIAQRPYVGSWKLNNQLLVKHTPDALVFVNGDLSIPGCDTLQTKVNLQPFIKSVSVDTSVEPGGHSATISLAVPRVYGESLVRDGRSVLKPTLEVHVYMRGYFPVKGLLDHLPDDASEVPIAPGATPGASAFSGSSFSVKNIPSYPYYHVFHGVVTQVNYEYSDGFYNMSLACASMLHFWQYQVITTNGSAFGARPRNSNVKMSLVGHNLTGMSPYGIIYMLYKDTAGAAAGVGFALSGKTNTNSVSQVTGTSLYSMAMLYWERRFRQTMYSLRMHGTNGRLFNGAQQAFLGTARTRDLKRLIKGSQYADMTKLHNSLDPVGGAAFSDAKRLRRREILGRITGQIGLTGQGFDVAYAERSREKGFSVNILDAQAYVSDIGNWGNVNLWESEYETKLDIANKVREVTGFEFYQDTDGDLVFKPPFYNMNTRKSRVYRIEDIDIISINFAEKEPNATMVTMKGSAFKNLAGTGLDNEFGVRGQYIDYRMVAQFGWRQHNMDISYFANPRSMFYAAVNKLDLLNIDTNSAQCTIPIRPELRPGYPVYIPFVDSYYYLTAFSHSHQFGSQCSTTMTLTGRRSKFFAPGDIEQQGIDKIKLAEPHRPPTPLQISDGIVPRLVGFPNVVMALDPNKTNPKYQILGGLSLSDITLDNENLVNQLIEDVMNWQTGLLKVDPEVTDFAQARFGESGTKKYIYQKDDKEVTTVDFQEAALGEFARIQQLRTNVTDAEAVIRDAVESGKKNVEQIIEEQNGKIDQARQELEAFSTSDSSAMNLLVQFYNIRFQNNDIQGRDQLEGVKDVRATAAYLDFLGDVKSNFVSDNVPGYYRYYSASHPDPESQGMKRLFEADASSTSADPDATGTETAYSEAVTYKDNQLARLPSPDRVAGFTKDASQTIIAPGEKLPEVTLVPGPREGGPGIEVTYGLLLAGARGSAPRPVPTHLIETISFAAVTLNKVTSFPGYKLNSNFSVPDSSVKIIQQTFQTLIYNQATQEAGDYETFEQETVGDTFGGAYDQLNTLLNQIEITFKKTDGTETTVKLGSPLGSAQDEDLDFPTATTNKGESGKGVIVSKTSTKGVGISEVTIEEVQSLATTSSAINEGNTRFFTFGARESVKKYKLNLSGGPIKEAKTLSKKRRAALRRVARYYGNNLARVFVESAQQALQDARTEDKAKVSRSINSILVNATAVPFIVSKNGKKLTTNRKLKKRIRRLMATYTPVFPVSDNAGYEVIGSYRYGRGIDIGEEGMMQKIYEAGNELVADAFNGVVNAENVGLFLEILKSGAVQQQAEQLFQQLMAGENLSGDVATVADNLGISKADVAKRRQIALSRSAALAVVDALGNRDDEGSKAFLEDLNSFQPQGQEDESEVIEALDISAGAKAWANSFANSVATNQDAIFKLPIVNGAYLLRDLADDLDVNSRGIVSCRGAEADLLLEAFGRTQFISLTDVVEGREPMAFLQEQAILQSTEYRAAQQALRGQVREGDAFDSLFDAWNRLKGALDENMYRGFRRQILDAGSNVKTVAERFKDLERFGQVNSADDFDRLARI